MVSGSDEGGGIAGAGSLSDSALDGSEGVEEPLTGGVAGLFTKKTTPRVAANATTIAKQMAPIIFFCFQQGDC